VAALPQFGINPMELRAAMKAVRRDDLDLRIVLGKLPNGAAVLESVEKMHAKWRRTGLARTMLRISSSGISNYHGRSWCWRS